MQQKTSLANLFYCNPLSFVMSSMQRNFGSGALWGHCGYNSYMVRAVRVAELKNQLSSFLHRVRAGEELLIRDRDVPIAKIVPLAGDEMDLDEVSLVASGQMILPKKQFDAKRFWGIGGNPKKSPRLNRALRQAVEAEREEHYAGVLGHKRHPPHMRSRTST